MSVRLSVHICDILLLLHLSPLYDVPEIQTIHNIYFLKAYHLAMAMTATKTYKKTKTHRQRQIQSDSKTQCMLFFQKQGVQGFKILYWLSSCDDKDKDKILGIFRGEYFSGGKDFLGMNMFRR